MKPHSPATNKGRTVSGDDVKSQQNSIATKASAKKMRHAARQEGKKESSTK